MFFPVDQQYRNKITSHFGDVRSYETHLGVDIALPVGSSLYSPITGKIIEARYHNNLAGNVIKVQNDNGYMHFFAHLKAFMVTEGQSVNEGDLIGYTGGAKGEKNSGNSTGPHLHWALFYHNKPRDPLDEINIFTKPISRPSLNIIYHQINSAKIISFNYQNDEPYNKNVTFFENVNNNKNFKNAASMLETVCCNICDTKQLQNRLMKSKFAKIIRRKRYNEMIINKVK